MGNTRTEGEHPSQGTQMYDDHVFGFESLRQVNRSEVVTFDNGSIGSVSMKESGSTLEELEDSKPPPSEKRTSLWVFPKDPGEFSSICRGLIGTTGSGICVEKNCGTNHKGGHAEVAPGTLAIAKIAGKSIFAHPFISMEDVEPSLLANWLDMMKTRKQ